MILLRFYLALILAFPVATLADSWTGKVISIQSGDRLTVRHGHRKVKVHLAGIEAPKQGQPGFRDSRTSLANFCRNHRARVSIEQPGPGLVEGDVACQWAGGFADMALFQVDQGWARLAPNTIDPDLVSAQNSAQQGCLGLWHQLCGLAYVVPPFVQPVVPQSPASTPTQSVKPTGISVTTTVPAATTGLITFSVTGTATAATVTFTTPQENKTETVNIPFESDAFSFSEGTFLSVFAQNQGSSGTVTVAIALDGVVQQTATTAAASGIVTVSCTRGSDC